MMMFIMFFIFMISFIFLNMKHPLTMGFTLLIQTFLISMLTGMYTKTFWFSYILFLIFIGGMLILFIYVTSLSSNEMFSMSFNLTFISIIFLTIFTFFLFILDKSIMENFINNNEMLNFPFLKTISPENSISLNKMYNFPTNLITLLLINYLFLTLLVVVKITKKIYGTFTTNNFI
uniref:NADH-ubiquinone oxidoreductase chain 6 n=1 Tax=Armigeres subalbatus TaxID=124917 RepID=A0A499PME6_ARMSU|nr:NADH dehydrogenase subunit 6 [Armigeres subalbatus]